VVIHGHQEGNVIDVIDSTNQGRTCLPIPNYPQPGDLMVATFFEDGIYSCGGGISDGRILGCFLLDENLIWVPVGMRAGIQGSASSIIDNTWWVTGGYTISFVGPDQDPIIHAQRSSWTFDGKREVSGDFLPYDVYRHCQVTINDTHVFIAGGYNDQSVYVTNWVTEEWMAMEDVPAEERFGEHCGLLRNPNYGPEILMADGRFSFIFSLTTETWREGPLMPEDIKLPTYQQLDDGILAIGGHFYQGRAVDTVYKFSEDTYQWELLDVTLSQPSFHLTTAAVPEDFLSCQ